MVLNVAYRSLARCETPVREGLSKRLVSYHKWPLDARPAAAAGGLDKMSSLLTAKTIPADADLDATAAIWADRQPDASRRLLLGALAAFARHGYASSTTREIADAADMSPAALYVHFGSKVEILVEITKAGHESVLAECDLAVEGEASSPERVHALVQRFASWHARHHTLARVTQYELRSLPSGRRKAIKKLRDQIEDLFASELRRGIKSGDFAVDDVDGTVIALLSMCIDVARWYSSSRPETPDSIGELYANLAVRMIRA